MAIASQQNIVELTGAGPDPQIHPSWRGFSRLMDEMRASAGTGVFAATMSGRPEAIKARLLAAIAAAKTDEVAAMLDRLWASRKKIVV